MLADEVRSLGVGDRVTTTAPTTRRAARAGVVVDVAQDRGHERCRVRWDDGDETFVYPGVDLAVERRGADAEPVLH